jgi:hypothetical protein
MLKVGLVAVTVILCIPTVKSIGLRFEECSEVYAAGQRTK